MRKLRQLTPHEVLFVGGETSTIYQHTSGLTLSDACERPDFGFEALRRHIEDMKRWLARGAREALPRAEAI